MAFAANAEKALVFFANNNPKSGDYANYAEQYGYADITTVFTQTVEGLSTPPAKPSAAQTVAVSDPMTLTGIGQITFDGAKAVANKTGKNFLQIDKTKSFTVVPAEGVTLTKMILTTTTSNTGDGITVNIGNYTDITADNLNAVWEGSATEGVTFTSTQGSNAYSRVQWMIIEYTTSGESAIDSVAADTDANVAYYTLQGLKVQQPAKGGLYIRTQGNTATKVIF